jgi:hypothetical protein
MKCNYTNWLRTLFFLFITLFTFFSIKAQKIDAALATYADKYAQERMYLHYDKVAYYGGETVWFKAYLMQDIFPAGESKTLYVDWVDENGNVLYHTVAPIVQGTANGQFDIPLDYGGNALHVKAYTKWMLNFDSSFLYSKSIPVLAKNKKATVKEAPVTTLQFFAEGGDAVAGVLSKFAFKATDQWGMPQKVKGIIQDNAGEFVDSFRTVHDGMGTLLLLPKEKASYVAKWRDEKGSSFSTPLPSIKESGASLQVFVAGNKRPFLISRSSEVPPNLKQLHLVGTMHEQIVFKANIALATVTAARGTIPTDQLPSGILTITLFDDQWNAIAERITFINNGEYTFKPELLVQQWGMKKRTRNEIQINLPDSIDSDLSIAITDAGIVKDTSENIITGLLLTSEIKGRVYRPSYYFKNNSDTLSSQLDLVMLTNGWRRFKWEEVTQGKFPKISYPKDTAYLALSGKVYGMQPGAADAATIALILKNKDSAGQMLFQAIEPDGTFTNPDFIFFDTLHVYYQVQKAKGAKAPDVRFMGNRLPALNYSRNKSALINRTLPDTAGAYRHLVLSQEEARIQELLRGKMLQNVTVTANRKSTLQQMEEKYTGGLFRGGDGYQFDLINDPSAFARGNVFEYLQGRVAGLQITASGADVNLNWRGGSPQVFLDEMPVDVSMITNIPMSEIAYVKVMRPPFVGAVGGGSSGAISVYTRKGGDVQSTPGKGLNNNTITGYTPYKQFYSPNYSTFDARNEQADMRTTLYWNPGVQTSPKKSSVTVSFFNNDVSKSFRVIIEGMTKGGQLTHYEEVLE